MPTLFPPTARFPAGLLPMQLDAGEIIVRIHRKGQGAVFFGPGAGKPPQNRFDAPAGEYGILYAARRLEGAFVETLLRRPSGRIVRRDYIEERQWTPIRLERPVILAKIMDEGLLFHGVDASVSASDDYALSRALAFDLYNDFPSIDGLITSIYGNRIAYICHCCVKYIVSSLISKHRDSLPNIRINH